jgi:hypothetical protein
LSLASPTVICAFVLDVVFLGAIGFAIVRAWQARFWAGLVAAVVRLSLLVTAIVLIGFSLLSPHAPAEAAPLTLAVFWAGPLVSFAMSFATWRRSKNVPYLQEREAHRVFMPWAVLACLDMVGVAFWVFALVIASEA